MNVIELERQRLTWHRPQLAAADEDRLQALLSEVRKAHPDNLDYSDPARIHLARAIGLGLYFLPVLAPEASDLPYDVMTSALQQA